MTELLAVACSVRVLLTGLLLMFFCQLKLLPGCADWLFCLVTLPMLSVFKQLLTHWLHLISRLAGLAFTFSLGVLLQLLVRCLAATLGELMAPELPCCTRICIVIGTTGMHFMAQLVATVDR